MHSILAHTAKADFFPFVGANSIRQLNSIRRVSPTLVIAIAICAAISAYGQTKPNPPVKKTTPQNTTKAQGQLAGVNGQFGVIYSFKGDFNFAILSAKYSIEPFIAYEAKSAGTEEKLLVLDIAIKNTSAQDNFWSTNGWFTLVDSKGQLIPGGSMSLQSKSSAENSFTLRPGQGLGQAAL